MADTPRPSRPSEQLVGQAAKTANCIGDGRRAVAVARWEALEGDRRGNPRVACRARRVAPACCMRAAPSRVGADLSHTFGNRTRDFERAALGAHLDRQSSAPCWPRELALAACKTLGMPGTSKRGLLRRRCSLEGPSCREDSQSIVDVASCSVCRRQSSSLPAHSKGSLQGHQSREQSMTPPLQFTFLVVTTTALQPERVFVGGLGYCGLASPRSSTTPTVVT